jgi:transposase
MAIKGGRRRWTAVEKLRIVLSGMDPGVEVSEVCRREGLNPTQYYAWRKQLMSSAERVFSENGQKRSRREERLEADLVRAKDVIAEITAENLELKKTFSG